MPSSGNSPNRGAGGLVGNLASGGQINNSYATGQVTLIVTEETAAQDGAGGLVGIATQTGSTITNSFSTGSVTYTGTGTGALAQHTAGGLVGTVNAARFTLRVNGSFWDVGTSGQSTSAGTVNGTNSEGPKGVTSDQLRDPATYTGTGVTRNPWNNSTPNLMGTTTSSVWAPPDGTNLPGLYGVSHIALVTPDNQTVGQNGSIPPLTGTTSFMQGGDTATASFTTSATSTSPTGSYDIAVSGTPTVNLCEQLLSTSLSLCDHDRNADHRVLDFGDL